MKKLKVVIIASMGAMFLFSGCSKEVINKVSPQKDSSDQTTVIANTTNIFPNYYFPPANEPHHHGPFVCNPFPGGSEPVTQKWNGVQAKLSYIPESCATKPKNLTEFQQLSTAANGSIFFSDISTPTTYFTRGFEKPDGTLLSDANGKPLLEWFSLQMDTKIRLSPWEKPGLKQFALLSDDGAILKINVKNKGFTTLINNDGLRESTFACASNAVWLGQNQDLPIHIDYFQGPRYHIALMLLWRTIPDQYGTGEEDSPILDSNSLKDSSCGKFGNEAFFKPSQDPSRPNPTALWDQIRKNGWEVVPAADYVLPGRNPINPCYYTK